MRERITRCLCQVANSVIIAGIIIFLTGLYYSIVKAGIPYQDPPLDLRIQYEINTGIGNVLTGSGFKIIICSSIVRFVLHMVCKIE